METSRHSPPRSSRAQPTHRLKTVVVGGQATILPAIKRTTHPHNESCQTTQAVQTQTLDTYRTTRTGHLIIKVGLLGTAAPSAYRRSADGISTLMASTVTATPTMAPVVGTLGLTEAGSHHRVLEGDVHTKTRTGVTTTMAHPKEVMAGRTEGAMRAAPEWAAVPAITVAMRGVMPMAPRTSREATGLLSGGHGTPLTTHRMQTASQKPWKRLQRCSFQAMAAAAAAVDLVVVHGVTEIATATVTGLTVTENENENENENVIEGWTEGWVVVGTAGIVVMTGAADIQVTGGSDDAPGSPKRTAYVEAAAVSMLWVVDILKQCASRPLFRYSLRTQ